MNLLMQYSTLAIDLSFLQPGPLVGCLEACFDRRRPRQELKRQPQYLFNIRQVGQIGSRSTYTQLVHPIILEGTHWTIDVTFLLIIFVLDLAM